MLIKLLSYVGLIIALLAGLIYWMQSPQAHVPEWIHNGKHSPEGPLPSKVNLMTYNIGFASGPNQRQHKPQEIKANLTHIIEQVRTHEVDILCVQEIDIQSNRSGKINQIQYIRHNGPLPHVAIAITWNHHWVPYPYHLTPQRHFGPTIAAQAIFSRWPIHEQTIQTFIKPKNQHPLYQLFYLNRLAQLIKTGPSKEESIQIANVHLEAFDRKTREIQAQKLAHFLQRHQKGPLIVAGDFNAIPETLNNDQFYPDEPKVNYGKDRTLPLLLTHPKLKLNNVHTDASFTFPSNNPNRQLDYCLYSPHFQVTGHHILVSTHKASDHLPILATFQHPQ